MSTGPATGRVGAARAATVFGKACRRSRASHKGLLLVGLLVLSLAGCGQKGPLYRPEKAPQPEAQASAAPAPAETLNPTASSD
jgi:predicted small lipoprotein YifL